MFNAHRCSADVVVVLFHVDANHFVAFTQLMKTSTSPTTLAVQLGKVLFILTSTLLITHAVIVSVVVILQDHVQLTSTFIVQFVFTQTERPHVYADKFTTFSISSN